VLTAGVAAVILTLGHKDGIYLLVPALVAVLVGGVVNAAKLRAALTAFNARKGAAFAKHFGRRSYFVPDGAGRTGRDAIARFVDERYPAGHGWTAAVLRVKSLLRGTAAPASRGRAVYRLDLVLTARGQPLRHGRAKLTVHFGSGLITTWTGPRQRLLS